MKNRKIVKHLKNGKYYLIEAHYKELYICYELVGYLPHDNSSADGNVNILTNIVRQYLFNKKDLKYLDNNEKYIMNNMANKYNDEFHQINEEFCEDYYNQDTYGGQKEYLDNNEYKWCKMIKEY
jgi:hypothetical protein